MRGFLFILNVVIYSVLAKIMWNVHLNPTECFLLIIAAAATAWSLEGDKK